MSLFDIIKSPVVSEKAYKGFERGMYTFWVDPNATKTDVKNAVQQAFGVRVVKVNVFNVEGKLKRTGKFIGRRVNRKKAMVTLAEGQKIDAIEGLV